MSVTKACNLMSSSAAFDATTNSTTSNSFLLVFSPNVFNTTSFLALISGFKSAFNLGLS